MKSDCTIHLGIKDFSATWKVLQLQLIVDLSEFWEMDQEILDKHLLMNLKDDRLVAQKVFVLEVQTWLC